MSETQTQGFAAAPAKDLPRLGCIGRVTHVEEAKESKSGNYMVVRIDVEGYGASRSFRNYFLYRPEWLTPTFKPADLKEIEGGDSMLRVYENNISQKGSISLLQGLAGGTKEGLDAVATAIFALPADSDTGGPSPEDVTEALRRVLLEEGHGNLIGYVLQQQAEKVGTDPETGKGIYANTPYYEVANWFVPNDKGRERVNKSAARATKGTFFVQFTEDDIPFN